MKINGITVKSSTVFEVSPYDVYANEDTNSLGNQVKDYVSTKRILKVEWVFLTQDEISTILSNINLQPFAVEYIDPELNTVTKNFYCNGKSSPRSLIQRDGTTMWDKLTCTFGEE